GTKVPAVVRYPARGCAAKPRADRPRSVNPGSATGCGANPERVLQNVNPKHALHRNQISYFLSFGSTGRSAQPFQGWHPSCYTDPGLPDKSRATLGCAAKRLQGQVTRSCCHLAHPQ